jgi:hypothetical protein
MAWLIFCCKKQPKQPGAAEGGLVAKQRSGNATAGYGVAGYGVAGYGDSLPVLGLAAL